MSALINLEPIVNVTSSDPSRKQSFIALFPHSQSHAYVQKHSITHKRKPLKSSTIFSKHTAKTEIIHPTKYSQISSPEFHQIPCEFKSLNLPTIDRNSPRCNQTQHRFRPILVPTLTSVSMEFWLFSNKSSSNWTTPRWNLKMRIDSTK
jgi:hypothetical protein